MESKDTHSHQLTALVNYLKLHEIEGKKLINIEKLLSSNIGISNSLSFDGK